MTVLRSLVIIAWLFAVAACGRSGPGAPVVDASAALHHPDGRIVSVEDMWKRVGPVPAAPGLPGHSLAAGKASAPAAGQAFTAVRLPVVPATRTVPRPMATHTVATHVGALPQPRPAAARRRADTAAGTQRAGVHGAGVRGAGMHVVVRGDTLMGVARRYRVALGPLARLNGLVAPFALYPGQRLLLPGGGDRLSTARPVARPVMSPAAAPPRRLAMARPVAKPVRPAAAPVAAGPAAQRNLKVSVAHTPVSRPEQGSTAVLRPVPAPPAPSGQFAWPVSGQVVAEFGHGAGGERNDGLNIAAPLDSPVRAAEHGVVVYAGAGIRGFGKLLLVKHGNGTVTAYGHNNSLLVQRGETVARGQVIARVGKSGNVDRPQLHFEIRRNRRAINPRQLLPANKT